MTFLLSRAVSQCSLVPHHRTCVGDASMVDLGGGVQALAINVHGQEREIVWAEGGIYFKVMGSTARRLFSDADLLSVAKTVAAAAASG
jgi:hypothetical protein